MSEKTKLTFVKFTNEDNYSVLDDFGGYIRVVSPEVVEHLLGASPEEKLYFQLKVKYKGFKEEVLPEVEYRVFYTSGFGEREQVEGTFKGRTVYEAFERVRETNPLIKMFANKNMWLNDHPIEFEPVA